jgi:hypothetical protein
MYKKVKQRRMAAVEPYPSSPVQGFFAKAKYKPSVSVNGKFGGFL